MSYKFQKQKIMENAKFISVFDDDIVITTECVFDKKTKIASDIKCVDVYGLDICHDEYVELLDGTIIRDFIYE